MLFTRRSRRRARVAAAALSFAAFASASSVFAETYSYNTSSGDWTTGANWTDSNSNTGISPGSGDVAVIGSSSHPGAAVVASVDITSGVSASQVYLGSFSGNGTLNLYAGGSLQTGFLQLGQTGAGSATLSKFGGTLDLGDIYVLNASILDLQSGDSLSIFGNLNVSDSGSTVNYNLSTNPRYFTQILDGGKLDLVGGTFETRFLQIGNSTAGSVVRGGGLLQVDNNVDLYAGSTLQVVAGDNFANANIQLREPGTTLNLGGNALQVYGLVMDGGSVTRGGGTLDLVNLYVRNGSTLSLVAGDSVGANGTLDVDGAGSVLDVNTALPNTLGSVHVDNGAALNLNGNTLHSYFLQIGSSTAGTLNRGGGLLDVQNGAVNLDAGSLLQVAAGDNFTNSDISVHGVGTTLDLNGNNLVARSLSVNAGAFTRGGANIDVTNLATDGGITLGVEPGDVIEAGGTLTVGGGSTVDVNTAIPNLIGTTNVVGSATLNLHGNTLHTSSLHLGDSIFTGSIVRGGANLDLQGEIHVSSGSTLSILNTDTLAGAGFSFVVAQSGSAVTYDNTPTTPFGAVVVVDGASFDLQGGTVRTNFFQLGNSSAGTLTRSGGLLDVATAVNLYVGSNLTLAAGDSFTTATINVYNSGTTLDLAGNNLTALGLNIDGGSVVRGGANVSLTNLTVAGGSTFAVIAGDSLAINGSINVNGTGSTLDFNAAVPNTLSSTIVSNDGTLNLNGNTLHTSYLQVGSSTAGTISRGGGTLDVQSVSVVAGSTFDLLPGDTIQAGGNLQAIGAGSTLNFNNNSAGPINGLYAYDGGTVDLQGGTVHTNYVQLGNSGSGTLVRSGGLIDVHNGAVAIVAGSTLPVRAGDDFSGASITLYGVGATVALDGNTLTALGLDMEGGAVTRVGGGNLNLTNLVVRQGSTLSLVAGDDLAAGGSVAIVDAGSSLTFNSAISNTLASVTVSGSGTLNLNGNTLRTGTLTVANGTLVRGGGNIELTSLSVNAGSNLSILSADTINAGGNFFIQNAGTSVDIDNNSPGGPSFVYIDTGATLSLLGGTLHAGSLSLNPTSTLNFNGGNLDAGSIDIAGGTVTRTAGSFSATSLSVHDGAVFDIKPGDTITAGGSLTVYGAGSTVNKSGPANNNLGNVSVYDGGTFNHTGGTVHITTLQLGNTTAGTFTRGGATMDVQAANIVAGSSLSVVGGDTIGTINISGAGSTVSVNSVGGAQIDHITVANDAVLNLNGGSVVFTVGAGGTAIGPNGGVSTVKFNGTTLKPSASSDFWLEGLTNANVQAGGAKFSTNGFDIRVGQSLSHDASLGAAPDGGLFKDGAGTLTLTGNNTYTGNTTVNSGRLQVNKTTALPGFNAPARVTVKNTGTLAVNVGGSGEWVPAQVDVLRANASFNVGSALAFDTSNAGMTPFNYPSNIGGVLGITKLGAGTVNLNGTTSYTGGTRVEAGTLQVKRMHENNPVTVIGGTLRVAHSAPLGSDPESGNDAFVSRPGSMPAISGTGLLDLTNNDLVVDYTNVNPTTPTDVENLVRSGFGPGQDWLGTTGITSSVAADDSNYMLAVANNGDLSAPFGNGITGPLFFGQSVDDTTVLVKFTWHSDITLDGLVDSTDAVIFSTNYQEGAPAVWMFGDQDYDGVYTSTDAVIFATNYNEALTSLPEPGAVAVLAVALFGLGQQRRRTA